MPADTAIELPIKPHNPLIASEGVQYTHRPVLYQKVPPLPRNKDKSAYPAQWWKEQFRRCRPGGGWVCPDDGVYDNPAYYFHNNFLRFPFIDERNGKNAYQSPLIIDVHREVFNDFYNSISTWKTIGGVARMKPAGGSIYAKGRRAGFTTDGWGFTMWHFVQLQQWDVAHLYPDEKTRNRENTKVRRLYAMLNDAFKFDSDRHPLVLVTQNQEVLEQGYWATNSDGSKTKVVVNRWYFAVASGDPGVLRGERMGLIFFVEAGKWSNLKNAIYPQIECIGQGNLRFGALFIGGTADNISNDSEDYKEIYYDPGQFNLKAVFLPPYKGRLGFIDYKTGISKQEPALEDILSKYANAAKSSDPKILQAVQQEFPITPEHCFIPPTSNEYDRAKLDEHLIWVRRNVKPEDFVYGNLVEERTLITGKPTGTIIFDVVENGSTKLGNWKLLRSALLDPKLNDQYEDILETDEFVIGFDDIQKDLKRHEIKYWNSDAAMVVINRRTKQIVGSYVYRPRIAELHQQAILALKYWPGLMNYEYNGDVFFEKLQAEQLLHRVIYWEDKGWGPKEKPGMYPQGTIEVQTMHMNAAIARGDYKQWMYAEAITELKKWQSVNTDFSSAHHLANIGLSKMPKPVEETQTQHQWKPVVQFGSQGSGMIGGYGSQGESNNKQFVQFGSRR